MVKPKKVFCGDFEFESIEHRHISFYNQTQICLDNFIWPIAVNRWRRMAIDNALLCVSSSLEIAFGTQFIRRLKSDWQRMRYFFFVSSSFSLSLLLWPFANTTSYLVIGLCSFTILSFCFHHFFPVFFIVNFSDLLALFRCYIVVVLFSSLFKLF